MQRRLDRILEAEQEAAAVLARRALTIRDRLLDAEDAEATVVVTTRSGVRATGRVATVATDHLELVDEAGTRLIAIEQLELIEIS